MSISKWLACIVQALLIWRNTLLFLDILLDMVDGVVCLDVQDDCLACGASRRRCASPGDCADDDDDDNNNDVYR